MFRPKVGQKLHLKKEIKTVILEQNAVTITSQSTLVVVELWIRLIETMTTHMRRRNRSLRRTIVVYMTKPGHQFQT